MIHFVEDQLDIDTYLGLRRAVSFKPLSRAQAEKALKNSLYILVAYRDGEAVGMGRVVGDGAVICYIQDLIIIPEVQGRGIGGRILEMLKEFAVRQGFPGTEMMLCLMSARGREPFYQKHGFIARPTENLGPGMITYLQIKGGEKLCLEEED